MGWVPPKKVKEENGAMPPRASSSRRPRAAVNSTTQDALFKRLSRPRSRSRTPGATVPQIRSRSAGGSSEAASTATSVFDRLAKREERRQPTDYAGWDKGRDCTFQPQIRRESTDNIVRSAGPVWERLTDDMERRKLKRTLK
eukprot:Hpha_TRINITY_DN15222_c2_g1::TRINITY_DN15222_c2_g1_i1::g.66815::m.66815